MIGHPTFEILREMGAFDSEEKRKQKADEERAKEVQASALTLEDVAMAVANRPRDSQSLPMREAAAAAVGLRVLSRDELRPKFKDGQLLPASVRFDQPEWGKVYAEHIIDPAAKKLIHDFIDLVGACELRWKVGPNERVLYQSVLDLGGDINLVAQRPRPSPADVAVVAAGAPDGVETDSTVPGWCLKTIERAPGYRWPLYQVLQDAHKAGKPCPKARDVLEVWRLDPPAELEVMSDGVKYNNGVGKQKEANLKAIQQAIKGLVK